MADDHEQTGDAAPTGAVPGPPPPPPPPPADAHGDASAVHALRSEVAGLARAVAALVDSDAERRQALARLGALVERTASRIDEIAGASTALRALGPDLEAALVEAGRRLGEQAGSIEELRTELAGLGPKVNDLVDRRPDWAAVLEPLDDRLTTQAEARSADRELLERIASQLGGLREVTAAGPDPAAVAAAVRDEIAPLAERITASGPSTGTEAGAELTRLAEAVERMGHRLTDGLGSVHDAAMAPAADLQATLSGRADRTDEQLAGLATQVADLASHVERLAGDRGGVPEALVARLDELRGAVDEVTAAVAALTWQLPESGRADDRAADPEALADTVAGLLDTRLADTVAALLDTGLTDAIRGSIADVVTDAVGTALADQPPPPPPTGIDDTLADTLRTTITDAIGTALADQPAPPPPPPPPPAPPEAFADSLRSSIGDTLHDTVRAAVTEAVAAALVEAGAGAPATASGPPDAPVTTALDLAPVQQRLDATAADIERAVADRTEVAMAGLLRLLDRRISALREDLSRSAGSGGSGGFEAGAVLGASQAAWNRLEDRLDGEFDDLGRQLHSLGVLVERALDAVEQRQPLVTGEGIRKAAASVRDTVVGASRNRRDRRGGPRGLGPGNP